MFSQILNLRILIFFFNLNWHSTPTNNHQKYFSDINLSVISEYKKQFPGINIGYSGHELGFIPTLGAVAKGAKVVERHFTLEKSLKGTSIYYVSTSWYKGIVLLTYLVTF